MNSYPTWHDKAKAALDASKRPKATPKPKSPTRAELIEAMCVEVRDLTPQAPALRGRLLTMLDAIAAAKR